MLFPFLPESVEDLIMFLAHEKLPLYIQTELIYRAKDYKLSDDSLPDLSDISKLSNYQIKKTQEIFFICQEAIEFNKPVRLRRYPDICEVCIFNGVDNYKPDDFLYISKLEEDYNICYYCHFGYPRIYIEGKLDMNASCIHIDKPNNNEIYGIIEYNLCSCPRSDYDGIYFELDFSKSTNGIIFYRYYIYEDHINKTT